MVSGLNSVMRLRPTRSIDRKSTRLNSSHLVISYAVFCLKNKKNTPFDLSAMYTGNQRTTSTSPIDTKQADQQRESMAVIWNRREPPHRTSAARCMSQRQ